MLKRLKRGFTLVELLVVIVIIGILAALLIPAIARAIRNARVGRCQNNLNQLWKMQANYLAQFGGVDKLFPQDTGGNFWLRLMSTNPALIDTTLGGATSSNNIYKCPLQPSFTPGTSQYRGPALDINNVTTPYGDGDPIGADVTTNHGTEGGNVLRKSADVIPCATTDAIWTLASTKTAP